MSSLSQLAILHTEARATSALSYGFEREGAKVLTAANAEALEAAVMAEGTQLVITGASSEPAAREALALVQGILVATGKPLPVLYFGNSISRADAISSGATEFIAEPAYVRDVVTLAKLLAPPVDLDRRSISGELSEHFGLFYLVRALITVQRTGVLTLMRGMRRAELRFYEGEVTSAQIGGLHGLPALHQMLLWANARFDLRDERVVRRQQIPMSANDVLADCQRFLGEIRSIAAGMSPSNVFVPVAERNLEDLPDSVRQVFRLFDESRTIADIIEDSPFRVADTLRIATRLLERGFLVPSSHEVPKHLMHTALAIEEWLTGNDTPVPIREDQPPGPAKGQPASPPETGAAESGSKRRKRRRGKSARKSKEAMMGAPVEAEGWADLLPTKSASLEPIAQVVPSSAAAGEINSSPSSRAADPIGANPTAPTRERFEEEVGATEQLSKIFVDETLGAVQSPVPRSSKTRDTARLRALPRKSRGDQEAKQAPREPGARRRPTTMSGELRAVKITDRATPAAPSIVVSERATSDPGEAPGEAEQPTVGQSAADLAMWEAVLRTAKDASSAAQAAIEAGVLQQPAAEAEPVTTDSAANVVSVAAAAEAALTEASVFSADEQAFFRRGTESVETQAPPVESFEDLDEAYELPKTLWQRLLADPNRDKRKK